MKKLFKFTLFPVILLITTLLPLQGYAQHPAESPAQTVDDSESSVFQEDSTDSVVEAAETLLCFAKIYLESEDYGTTIKYCSAIIDDFIELKIQNNFLLAETYLTLAKAYLGSINHKEGLNYLILAEETLDKEYNLFKSNDTKYLYSEIYTNLITTYLVLGLQSEAEIYKVKYHELDLPISFEQSYYSDTFKLAEYISLGKYDEALSMAYEIFSKPYWEIISNSQKSTICFMIGHTAYCIQQYNYCLNFFEKGFNYLHIKDLLYHYNYYNLLPYYAFCHFHLGNYDLCQQYYLIYINYLKSSITSNFAYLTSSGRDDSWKQLQHHFFIDLPKLASFFDNSEFLNAALDGMLMSKGLLLNTELELKNLIYEKGDNDLIAIYENIRNLKNLLDTETQKTNPDSSKIESLQQEIESLDKKLALGCSEYGEYTHNLAISWKDVQEKLNKKDIAIEFYSVPYGNSIYYSAYLFDKYSDIPKTIPLFEEKELDNFYNELTNWALTPELGEVVWRNLMPYLKDAKNIYFAAAGKLHTIPIETSCVLPTELTKKHFYRLSSTREIAIKRPHKNIKTATLYGGIKYDADWNSIIADSKNYPSQDQFALRNDISTSNRSYFMSNLENTLPEVEDISKILKNSKVKSIIHSDYKGNEASFKALSGKKENLIHIATHGLYESGNAEEVDNSDFSLWIGTFGYTSKEDDALSRSKIFFAGAANMDNPPDENVDDGILTAKEISQLDLRECDLVVLSACQTGLGDIDGEGVFGMQRGFKKAGVNSILMSLWSVHDEATKLLMIRFYENLFKRKMNKSESLREAQNFVCNYQCNRDELSEELYNTMSYLGYDLDDLDSQRIKPFKHPYFWAAFVLLDALN